MPGSADELCLYRPNPHHQRAKLLELTAAGRSALHTIDTAQHTWCDTLAATPLVAQIKITGPGRFPPLQGW